jgi:hypothetical protein
MAMRDTKAPDLIVMFLEAVGVRDHPAAPGGD